MFFCILPVVDKISLENRLSEGVWCVILRKSSEGVWCVVSRKSSEVVYYLTKIVRGGVLSCENRPRGCVILRKSSEGVCYLTTIVGRGVVCYHTKIVGGGVVCCLACCTRYSTSYAAVLVVSLVSGPVPLSLFGEVTYVCIHRPCVCR